MGEGEPWLDDAAAWIERSRQLQREREMAERRVGFWGGGWGGVGGNGGPPPLY